MSFDLPALRAAVQSQQEVIRILILSTRGSVPRGKGTSMLVWRDGQHGTIGGGVLEHEATTRARQMLAAQSDQAVQQVALGPGIGQCCGGAVRLLFERFTPQRLPRSLPYWRPIGPADPRPEPGRDVDHSPCEHEGWLGESAAIPSRDLWIWGAGHVGRALVHVLAPLPDFSITWVDFSPKCFPAEPPAGVCVLPAQRPERLVPRTSIQAEHLILTRSHSLDLALCGAVLRHGCRFIGLIGSDTKWARFRRSLQAQGLDAGRITCPIGDPSLGKHPQQIAISVAGMLLSPTAREAKRKAG